MACERAFAASRRADNKAHVPGPIAQRQLQTAIGATTLAPTIPRSPIVGMEVIEPAETALVRGKRSGRVWVDAVAEAGPAHGVTVTVARGLGGVPPHGTGTESRYFTNNG